MPPSPQFEMHKRWASSPLNPEVELRGPMAGPDVLLASHQPPPRSWRGAVYPHRELRRQVAARLDFPAPSSSQAVILAGTIISISVHAQDGSSRPSGQKDLSRRGAHIPGLLLFRFRDIAVVYVDMHTSSSSTIDRSLAQVPLHDEASFATRASLPSRHILVKGMPSASLLSQRHYIYVPLCDRCGR